MTPRQLVIDAFKKWNVPLRILKLEEVLADEHRFPDGYDREVTSQPTWSSSPSNYGGIVRRKDGYEVIWSRGELDRHYHLCALIHELAHVLEGEHPEDADEVHSSMLAIEVAHHELCSISPKGIARWMEGFGLSEKRFIGDWDEAPVFLKHDLLHESREHAVRAGLMKWDGTLTFQRKR